MDDDGRAVTIEVVMQPDGTERTVDVSSRAYEKLQVPAFPKYGDAKNWLAQLGKNVVAAAPYMDWVELKLLKECYAKSFEVRTGPARGLERSPTCLGWHCPWDAQRATACGAASAPLLSSAPRVALLYSSHLSHLARGDVRCEQVARKLHCSTLAFCSIKTADAPREQA